MNFIEISTLDFRSINLHLSTRLTSIFKSWVMFKFHLLELVSDCVFGTAPVFQYSELSLRRFVRVTIVLRIAVEILHTSNRYNPQLWIFLSAILYSMITTLCCVGVNTWCVKRATRISDTARSVESLKSSTQTETSLKSGYLAPVGITSTDVERDWLRLRSATMTCATNYMITKVPVGWRYCSELFTSLSFHW